MGPSSLEQLRQEAAQDGRRLSIAISNVHRRLHLFSRQGWNKCEKEPCHSAGVVLGDLAILSMELDPTLGPTDAA